MIQYIEGKMLRDMFVSGANNLQNHKDLPISVILSFSTLASSFIA